MITLGNIRTLTEAYIDSDDMFPGCDVTDMEYLGESILHPYVDAEMINEGVLGSIWETIKKIVKAIVNFFRTLFTKIGNWIKGFFGKIRNAISGSGGGGGSSIPKELKELGITEKEVQEMAAAAAKAVGASAAIIAAMAEAEDGDKAEEAVDTVVEKIDDASDAELDKVAKAVGEQPPKTEEEKAEVVKKAKVVLKGAKRLKYRKFVGASGSQIELTLIRLYEGIPRFTELDENLTKYIIAEANADIYPGTYLIKNIDTIEALVRIAEEDDSDEYTEDDRKRDEKSNKRRVNKIAGYAADDGKELAKCFGLSKDTLIDDASTSSNASELGITKTKEGQIQSRYLSRYNVNFSNRKDAQKKALMCVDNCEKFAENLQKLCSSAEAEYKKCEDTITKLAAKYSNDKGKGVLNLVKFHQLKAGIFNKIFMIHVNDARDSIKTITRQYLGNEPTDLKRSYERDGSSRKDTNVIAKVKQDKAGGKIKSYSK